MNYDLLKSVENETLKLFKLKYPASTLIIR